MNRDIVMKLDINGFCASTTNFLQGISSEPFAPVALAYNVGGATFCNDRHVTYNLYSTDTLGKSQMSSGDTFRGPNIDGFG